MALTLTTNGAELVAVSALFAPTSPSDAKLLAKSATPPLRVARSVFLCSRLESWDCNCVTGICAIWTARVRIDWKSEEKVLTPVKISGVLKDVVLTVFLSAVDANL